MLQCKVCGQELDYLESAALHIFRKGLEHFFQKSIGRID